MMRTIWILGILLLGASAAADDWPQSGRSSTRNAVSPEKDPPSYWQTEERAANGAVVKDAKNIRWVANAVGNYSNTGEPVVADGLIWVSSVSPRSERDACEMVCLDETSGKVLYRYVSPRLGIRAQDFPLTGMNCSPYVERNRVWFVSNRCEVVCLDIEPLRKKTGLPAVLWKLDMRKDLGVVPYALDFVALRRCSIACHREFLYVTTGNGVDESRVVPAPNAPSLVCLEKAGGKVVWSDSSPGKKIICGQPSSPLVIEVKGQAHVIAGQGDGWLRSFDAMTGKLIWEFDLNPLDEPVVKGTSRGGRNWPLATPVYSDGRIYIGTGQDGEHGSGRSWLYCIDPTRTGNISPELPDGELKGNPNPNSGMIWRYGGRERDDGFHRFCRTLSNVTVADGLVVAPDFDGRVHCLDAKTGHRYWALNTESTIYSSPLVVDGKIYVGNTSGEVWIVNLSKSLRVISKIEMPSSIRYNPIFANGVLYIASGQLYAIAGGDSQ